MGYHDEPLPSQCPYLFVHGGCEKLVNVLQRASSIEERLLQIYRSHLRDDPIEVLRAFYDEA